MTYDLKDDPLLKDMGHEGPTIFSALMLFYISYSEWDSKRDGCSSSVFFGVCGITVVVLVEMASTGLHSFCGSSVNVQKGFSGCHGL